MSKSVLIAMPTLGLDPDPNRWLMSLLTIQNDIRFNGMSQAFLPVYKSTWWPANNQIWNTAISNGFDYILRIDDDIWNVSDDAFTKLLKADKDVIGACYPMRQFPYPMCALKRTVNKSLLDIWRGNREGLAEVSGSGVVPVDLVGFGMTLIKVEPFKNFVMPMYDGHEICPDDTYFAQKCLDRGIQQYVHMDVKLCHREVTPSNRLYLYNAEAREMLASGDVSRETGLYKELSGLFGEDGLKDIGTLKAIGAKQ